MIGRRGRNGRGSCVTLSVFLCAGLYYSFCTGGIEGNDISSRAAARFTFAAAFGVDGWSMQVTEQSMMLRWIWHLSSLSVIVPGSETAELVDFQETKDEGER